MPSTECVTWNLRLDIWVSLSCVAGYKRNLSIVADVRFVIASRGRACDQSCGWLRWETCSERR